MTDLKTRLRDAVKNLRRTSMPVADVIPMLQQAADRIAELESINRTTPVDLEDRQAMSHADMLTLCEQNPALASGLPLEAKPAAGSPEEAGSKWVAPDLAAQLKAAMAALKRIANGTPNPVAFAENAIGRIPFDNGTWTSTAASNSEIDACEKEACGAAYDAIYSGKSRGAGYSSFERGWMAALADSAADSIAKVPVATDDVVAVKIGYTKGHREDGLQAEIVDLSLVHDGMLLYARRATPVVSETKNHVSDGEYSKAVRQEIKRRFNESCRTQEGAVLLTYSSEAIRAAENGGKLSVSECATWFIERSEEGYAK